jgi:hypothetical protein
MIYGTGSLAQSALDCKSIVQSHKSISMTSGATLWCFGILEDRRNAPQVIRNADNHLKEVVKTTHATSSPATPTPPSTASSTPSSLAPASPSSSVTSPTTTSPPQVSSKLSTTPSRPTTLSGMTSAPSTATAPRVPRAPYSARS